MDKRKIEGLLRRIEGARETKKVLAEELEKIDNLGHAVGEYRMRGFSHDDMTTDRHLQVNLPAADVSNAIFAEIEKIDAYIAKYKNEILAVIDE